jgi:acylphosphatase
VACVKFIVSGAVQGVFFRASTRAEAQRLGLHGHAKNLAGGSVEVLACGDAAALEALAEWLQDGPPLARVTEVQRSAVDDESAAPTGFRVL